MTNSSKKMYFSYYTDILRKFPVKKHFFIEKYRTRRIGRRPVVSSLLPSAGGKNEKISKIFRKTLAFWKNLV